jgi:hypothetical protein
MRRRRAFHPPDLQETGVEKASRVALVRCSRRRSNPGVESRLERNETHVGFLIENSFRLGNVLQVLES